LIHEELAWKMRKKQVKTRFRTRVVNVEIPGKLGKGKGRYAKLDRDFF
jgi:hypothetical protein